MDRIRCFKAILLTALFAFLFSWAANSWAETVAITFNFDGPSEGYNLYMDEAVYCTIDIADVVALPEISLQNRQYEMTCDPSDIAPGWHMFTMTANIPERNGVPAQESGFSNVFRWFKPFPQANKPTVITITINGETIIQ